VCPNRPKELVELPKVFLGRKIVQFLVFKPAQNAIYSENNNVILQMNAYKKEIQNSKHIISIS
jgi:hypothetical protein